MSGSDAVGAKVAGGAHAETVARKIARNATVALYAAEHPEHVEAVVQIGPAAVSSETAALGRDRRRPVNPEELAYLAKLRDSGHAESDPVGYCHEWLTRQLLPSITVHPDAVARARMDPCQYENEWPEQVRKTLSLVLPPTWDFSDRARRVRAPVLTIHGRDDSSAPIEAGREWADLLPDARLVELEGVGHVPFLEAPERFFQEVDTFLGRGGTPGPFPARRQLRTRSSSARRLSSWLRNRRQVHTAARAARAIAQFSLHTVVNCGAPGPESDECAVVHPCPRPPAP